MAPRTYHVQEQQGLASTNDDEDQPPATQQMGVFPSRSRTYALRSTARRLQEQQEGGRELLATGSGVDRTRDGEHADVVDCVNAVGKVGEDTVDRDEDAVDEDEDTVDEDEGEEDGVIGTNDDDDDWDTRSVESDALSVDD